MDQNLILTFHKLTAALNATNARLDQIDARIDRLVQVVDDHVEIPWATKRDLEAIQVQALHMRREMAELVERHSTT